MSPYESNKAAVRAFFSCSDTLDYLVLRPLSHIRSNWEITWDERSLSYFAEEDSYAELLNRLIEDIALSCPPVRYHDNEDKLADYVISNLKWTISKQGNLWVGADYNSIIEQGGSNGVDQCDLVLAAAGRVKAAIERGQGHFDDMEESHRRMLGAVMSVVLYHRS